MKPCAPGTVVADRFELDAVVGRGGMGVVHRARDLSTGAKVAVKLVRTDDADHLRLFLREARLLAGIEHPGIVRYVTHGIGHGGEAFLVMEWLEGEDLAARLKRGTLDEAETRLLGARVADALGHAHRRGVLHRDIKPANLFLPNGDLERVKILDFGLARPNERSLVATATGAVLGSPGFMSPEQARGARDIDARTDVYSLGCVLHACLLGEPPFTGKQLLPLLNKILFHKPRGVRERASGELDELLQRMLAKEPSARPADAGEVKSALAALARSTTSEPHSPPGDGAVATLTIGEQRRTCVLFARGSSAHEVASVLADRSARVSALADGVAVAVFSTAGSVVDTVAAAARCALALRDRVPGVALALATGHADVALSGSAAAPAGEAFDRAASLAGDAGGAILVDALSARLLRRGFALTGARDRLLLEGEYDAVQHLAGTGERLPFLGRERQLAALEALYDECVDQAAPRLILVTAPLGGGKSRMARELAARVTARTPAPEVCLLRGDSAVRDLDWRLRQHAPRQSLLMVLDDVPWTDPDVRQRLLATLRPRRLDDRPMLALALARTSDAITVPPDPAVDAVPLPPLARKVCECLVRTIFANIDEAAARGLAERCEGNPLLLEELLNGGADATRGAPPAAVALVEHRLFALTAEQRQLLRAASILGVRFTRVAVAKLLGRPVTELTRRFEELVALDWIAPPQPASRGAEQLVHAFRRELDREAAYDSLLPADRERAEAYLAHHGHCGP